MRTSSPVRQHRPLALGLAAVAATFAVTTTSAAHAAPSSGELTTPSTERSPAAAGAAASAERTMDVQADRITADLGAHSTGGAFISAGRLVVTVTDEADRAAVRQSGAKPRVVEHSARQLETAHQSLDRFAEEHGAGAVQGWHVDVEHNTVVVTVADQQPDRATAAFLSHARSLGERVTVERAQGKATVAAYLYGGQQIEMSTGGICSNGFNARTSAGGYAMVTAGHCAEGSPSFRRNGVTIGGTIGYSFPGNDYAAATINDPSYWNPQAAIDMYNGYARPVAGASQAPVGSSLCKSGRTTGWTCGTIEAYNQTVNYGNGDIVYGLVRHSACVEQGDSGGSNMSGNYAQGVSSGGQLYQSGGRLVCGEKVGQPNVSYYQPVQEALSGYDLTLMTY